MLGLQSGLEIIGAIAGGIYIVAQIDANAKANKESIAEIKALIEKNMESTKELLNTSKEHQKEALEREINHLKDLINLSSSETREDIKRLEAKQAESNRIKERLARNEASLKSLHKRLDLEPIFLGNDEIEN